MRGGGGPPAGPSLTHARARAAAIRSYQCFRDASGMADAIKGKNPQKIDIGAVYNLPPAQVRGGPAYSGGGVWLWSVFMWL